LRKFIGSTAYSLSAGGSLVHPDIPAILLTPICPHTLSFRPMLLNDSMLLRVHVPVRSRATAYCSFDGKGRVELRQGDHVTITASPYPFPAVLARPTDWFDSIGRTLLWNSRAAQQKSWGGGSGSGSGSGGGGDKKRDGESSRERHGKGLVNGCSGNSSGDLAQLRRAKRCGVLPPPPPPLLMGDSVCDDGSVGGGSGSHGGHSGLRAARRSLGARSSGDDYDQRYHGQQPHDNHQHGGHYGDHHHRHSNHPYMGGGVNGTQGDRSGGDEEEGEEEDYVHTHTDGSYDVDDDYNDDDDEHEEGQEAEEGEEEDDDEEEEEDEEWDIDTV
jgi:hypothetical protein